MAKFKNILVLGGVILLVILGTIFMIRRKNPIPAIIKEIEAYIAVHEVNKKVAKLGHEAAMKEIEDEHKEIIAKLEKENKDQVDKARKSPQAFSRMIARSGDSI